MKKRLISLAVAAASSLAGQAQASTASCDDPLTSTVGARFCERLFGYSDPIGRHASFADRTDAELPVVGSATQARPAKVALPAALAETPARTSAPSSHEALTSFALQSTPSVTEEAASSPRSAPVTSVPEPSIYALLLGGLGIVLFRIFQAAR